MLTPLHQMGPGLPEASTFGPEASLSSRPQASVVGFTPGGVTPRPVPVTTAKCCPDQHKGLANYSYLSPFISGQVTPGTWLMALVCS